MRLLRAQRYHSKAHGETRGHLKEGTVTGRRRKDRDLMVTCVDNSATDDKHVDRNACIFRVSRHTYMPLNPPPTVEFQARNGAVNAVSENSKCGSKKSAQRKTEHKRKGKRWRSKRKTSEKVDSAILW